RRLCLWVEQTQALEVGDLAAPCYQQHSTRDLTSSDVGAQHFRYAPQPLRRKADFLRFCTRQTFGGDDSNKRQPCQSNSKDASTNRSFHRINPPWCRDLANA